MGVHACARVPCARWASGGRECEASRGSGGAAFSAVQTTLCARSHVANPRGTRGWAVACTRAAGRPGCAQRRLHAGALDGRSLASGESRWRIIANIATLRVVPATASF